jgi:hypothetical protein
VSLSFVRSSHTRPPSTPGVDALEDAPSFPCTPPRGLLASLSEEQVGRAGPATLTQAYATDGVSSISLHSIRAGGPRGSTRLEKGRATEERS